MGKRKNLQPWLDYFRMLQTYEEKGFLQMEPEKNEAYVTASALATLAGTAGQSGAVLPRDYAGVIRRIRVYAGWMRRDGKVSLDRPFAMHVVNDGTSHDPVCTVLLTRRRRWWSLWRLTDEFEFVEYGGGGNADAHG